MVISSKRSITAIWKWLGFFLLMVFLIAVAFFYDNSVRSWIDEHQTPFAKSFMNNVSRFGDWPALVGTGLMLLGIAYWRGSRKWMRVLLTMILACAMAGIAARAIKITSGRARPSVQSEAVWTGPNLSSKFNAFPSGHTAAATAFFAVLLFACCRLGALFLPIPLLIAASRMYLGAHYLSDVVFAAILGILCAVLARRLVPAPISNQQLR